MNYERIIAYALNTPWAIRPDALGAILDVVRFRAAGGKYTDEELVERLEAARAQNGERAGGRTRGSVAVVPLYGPIFPKANLFTELSGATSLSTFAATLRKLDADDQISQIVIDVDSPGGSVELVPETAELIRGLKTPTVAVANTEAASAAYWLAAQADELVVTPSGAVGSIGVWAAHEDWSVHDANLGVRTTLISAGKYKVEGNPFGPLDDEARAAIQADVDAYYGMFVDAVAEGRRVPPQDVRDGFGQGRMVLARAAVRMGMADRVATLDQVVADAAAGIRRGRNLLGSRGEPVEPAEWDVTVDAPTADAADGSGAAPETETPAAEWLRLLSRPKVREMFAPSGDDSKVPALAGGETGKEEQ